MDINSPMERKNKYEGAICLTSRDNIYNSGLRKNPVRVIVKTNSRQYFSGFGVSFSLDNRSGMKYVVLMIIGNGLT